MRISSAFLLHVDPLGEELNDARLLGREQLVPDRGEVREQDRDLAFGDLFTRSLRCRARSQLRCGAGTLGPIPARHIARGP
jgi:hypothetical protein